MSNTLYCDFLVEAEKDMVYWWPLLFEAMQRRAFSFYVPDFEEPTCHYSYERADSYTDSDIVTGPFKGLWEEILSRKDDSLMVTFWWRAKEPLNMDVSVTRKHCNQKDMFCISLSFSGAYISARYNSPTQIKKRLTLFFDCATTLYEVCDRRDSEVYWEFAGVNYAPWASFNKLPDAPTEERPAYEGSKGQFKQQEIPDNQSKYSSKLYILDPSPIVGQQYTNWQFISFL